MIAMDTKKLVAGAEKFGKGDWFRPINRGIQMAEINKAD